MLRSRARTKTERWGLSKCLCNSIHKISYIFLLRILKALSVVCLAFESSQTYGTVEHCIESRESPVQFERTSYCTLNEQQLIYTRWYVWSTVSHRASLMETIAIKCPLEVIWNERYTMSRPSEIHKWYISGPDIIELRGHTEGGPPNVYVLSWGYFK